MNVIRSVTFEPDGSVVVNYMDPITDVRNGQLLVMGRQLIIAPGEGGRDYGDEIEDVRDAANRLLRDALDDWVTTPVDSPQPVELDEEVD